MKFNFKTCLPIGKIIKTKLKDDYISAFTLVETMVATVIIVIAVSGPLSVAVASSGYVRDTKDNMTSVYLAQEAVDLLRYKRNSIAINCSVNNDVSEGSLACPAINLEDNYSPITGTSSAKESAWRIFKDQIGLDIASGNASCFSVDGCFYDLDGFIGKGPVQPPVTYNSEGCGYLYRKDNGTGDNSDDFMYLCTSGPSGDYTKTHFSRKVVLERIATSTPNSYIYDYEDDIRAIVTVTYVRHNGLIKEIKLVDFIHSK